MSLYALLGVSPTASTTAILEAGVDCRSALEKSAPDILVKDCMDYIDDVCRVLCDPSSRECYDAIRRASDGFVSPHHASMVMKHAELHNMGTGVKFGDSFTHTLRLRSQETTDNPLLFQRSTKPVPSCRWCDAELDLDNAKSVICKCDSRSGHSSCVRKFKQKHNRCPVCRGKLLHRTRLSKYMFFNKSRKYQIR